MDEIRVNLFIFNVKYIFNMHKIEKNVAIKCSESPKFAAIQNSIRKWQRTVGCF